MAKAPRSKARKKPVAKAAPPAQPLATVKGEERLGTRVLRWHKRLATITGGLSLRMTKKSLVPREAQEWADLLRATAAEMQEWVDNPKGDPSDVD